MKEQFQILMSLLCFLMFFLYINCCQSWCKKSEFPINKHDYPGIWSQLGMQKTTSSYLFHTCVLFCFCLRKECLIECFVLGHQKFLLQQNLCEELHGWKLTPWRGCGFPSPEIPGSSGCFYWGWEQPAPIADAVGCFCCGGQQEGAQGRKLLSCGRVSACLAATAKGCDRYLPGQSLVLCAFTKKCR